MGVGGKGGEKIGSDLLSRLVGSIIGAGGLNGSVRNGKRWNPVAITTVIYLLRTFRKTASVRGAGARGERWALARRGMGVFGMSLWGDIRIQTVTMCKKGLGG